MWIPQVFNDTFVGVDGMNQMKQFWTNAQRSLFGQTHPALKNACLEFMIPIQHHCDGASFMNKVEYTIWSVSSATTRGNTFDTKMLITILESDLLVDYVTEKEVVGYLTWCQEVLQSGLWPQKGYKGEALSGYRWQHRGESLAGPWRGAFSLWKGDLKAKVKTHGYVKRMQQQ